MSAAETAAKAATPLLVPIQLDALVIEADAGPGGELLLARHTAERGASLRWKATRANYVSGLRTLIDPKLTPFLGAVPEAGGRLALRESERPKAADRGVYLRWLVPAGLRKSLAENSLNFPALPDQWLIVRLARRAASRREVELKAWVIDGSAYPGDATSSASLPVARPGKSATAPPELAATPVGVARTLEAYDAAQLAQMAHTTLTALGTAWTGSPTFSTSLAENRNILSWHDGLADLRDGQGRLALAAVSYAVVGWYRTPGADPLAALPQMLKDAAGRPVDRAAVLAHLGWTAPPGLPEPAGPCLFHGALAHINFWDGERYRGPLLGYPQSPPAHGGLAPPEARLEVGLGSSAPAALAALVSDQWWTDEFNLKDRPKWAVLEGHLLGAADPAGLDPGTRRRLDHPLGFTSLEAGVLHALVQGADAADKGPAPTAAQRQQLARLNGRQSALNDEVRGLVARANALRMAWRERIVAVRTGTLRLSAQPDPLAGLQAELDAFARAVEAATATAAAVAAELAALAAGLPKGWSLQAAPEPPFWVAADPVVMLAGLPGASRGALPEKLTCRMPASLVANAPVVAERAAFPTEALSALAASLVAKGLPQAGALAGVLREAALMEQAVASTAFAEPAPFAGQIEWERWKSALQARFRSGADGSLTLAGADGRAVLPEALVAVWGQQPWSPLYIDWNVSWHASPAGLKDWTFPTGQRALHYDYRQPDGVPAAGREAPAAVKGRSLMAPMDGGFLTTALNAAIAESDLNHGDFAALTRTPLVGQTLAGLGASLRRLNAQALTPRPDAALPWLTPATDERLQAGTTALARLAAGLRIAMPAPLPPLAAAPGETPALEAGWFRLDHLWVVDDFGQWAEPVARPGTRVQPHPRSRLRLGAAVDDTQCGPFARPPRLSEGARLDVSFVGPQAPIRGWVYLNRLDHALVVCAGDGRLLGELALRPAGPGGAGRVVWHSLAEAAPVAVTGLGDPVLAHLVAWLADPADGADRLARMLAMVAEALPTIRAREAAPEQMLIGRPLAVVVAQARLQSFRGTPGEAARALALPLRLGNRPDPQDGLVGHAQGLAFAAFAGLDGAPAPRAGFATASELVLLMDPTASVEVACGVLPARALSLPADEVRAALARLEIGFGVGPVLFHGALPVLPPPASTGGTWELRAADGAVSAVAALGIEPRFDGAPPAAGEGWLILRRPEPPATTVPQA